MLGAAGRRRLYVVVPRERLSRAPPKPRLLDRVRQALCARHMSRRTEKAHGAWIRILTGR
jgi:hypothetical protein